MFKDKGKRLVTRQAYPDAVTDMLKIAQHRGWNQVRVSGDRRQAFKDHENQLVSDCSPSLPLGLALGPVVDQAFQSL